MDSEARSLCRKVKSSCDCDECRSRKADSWLRSKRPSLFPMCDQFRKAYLEDDRRKLERLGTLFEHVRCICCGYTLLHLAVGVGSRELVELYLSRKADVTLRTDSGETALHLACALDDSWFTERLLVHGAEAGATDEMGCTPLQLCLSLAEPPRAILRSLLAKGARPNRLFEGGVDEMVRANAKNAVGVLPLYEAVHRGDHVEARRLLREGACPDCLGLFRRTLLQVASFNGSLECAEALVAAGVDINESDLEGRTALHHAVISESAEIANLLLRNKCDMWARDSDGYTALGMAALTNRRRVTDELLDHGARCTESLLLEALERRCTDTALAILRRGYLRVQGNKFGRTLLYCAVMTEQHEVVEYLQSIGVEVEFEGSEDDEEVPRMRIEKQVEPTRKRSHLPVVATRQPRNCKLTKYSRGTLDATTVSGLTPRRDRITRHKKCDVEKSFLVRNRIAEKRSSPAIKTEASSAKKVAPSVKVFIKPVSRKPTNQQPNVDSFFHFYCEKPSSKSTLTAYEGAVCLKSRGKDKDASSNVDTFFKFYKYCVQ